MKSQARTWFDASRPFSFTASVIPVLVGTALAAEEEFRLWAFLLALFGSVFIHAGTNLVNDYYDWRKGTDGEHSLGPPSAIQRGTMTPNGMLIFGLVCFAIGGACGIVLCITVSWSLLWIGLASIAVGFLYTGAPLHLAYIGLGEVAVFIFMGPVIVMGSYYVQVEQWTWEALVASLPIGFLVTAILHANNIRDIDNDRRTGKRTIATVIGRGPANIEMYVLLIATYVSLIVAALVDAMPWWGLLALATAPAAIPIMRLVREGGGARNLNMALLKTAQLHMQFGALMALGLTIGAVVESL